MRTVQGGSNLFCINAESSCFIQRYLALICCQDMRCAVRRVSGRLSGFRSHGGFALGGYNGIMENKMETTIMENQMETKMENELETGGI